MDFKELFKEERAIAQKISEQTYNGTPGTGYQYFRKEEGKEYSHRGVCLAFIAIEYDELDSYFLAGPFIKDKKHYGLLSVYQAPVQNLKSLQEYIDDMRERQLKGSSTSYMPYTARKRIDEYVKECIFYWDDVTRQSYSSLDLDLGKHEIPEDVLSRLKPSGKTQVFFNTKAATAKILEIMTSQEIAQWGESLKHSADRIEEEMRKTQVCKEKPFYIHLAGTDDCSWGAAFQNEQEVFDTIEAIYDSDNVRKLLWFTN